MQVAASIKPSFLELNATRLINLDRANDVSSHDRAAHAVSIKTRVESAAWYQRLKLEYNEPLSKLGFSVSSCGTTAGS